MTNQIGESPHAWRFVIVAAAISMQTTAFADVPPTADKPWRAVHVISFKSDESLEKLAEQLPALAKLGVNCLILEVNYSFEFQSHPELRNGNSPITKAGAARFVDACRAQRHRGRAAVSMSRPSVLGEEHRPAAHEVSRARSDARCVSRQQGPLLPRVGPDEPADERDRVRAHRRNRGRLRRQGVPRRHGRSVLAQETSTPRRPRTSIRPTSSPRSSTICMTTS